MRQVLVKQLRKQRRQTRTRNKLRELAGKLRLSVFRSNRYIYAQIIDDVKGVTLASASEQEIKTKEKMNPTQKAEALGKVLAEKAKAKKITGVVFDKGSYSYHGRVKAFADSARKEGLQF